MSQTAFNELHAREVSRQRRLRGCEACAVVDRCPACVYLGSLSVEAYCRIMRGALERTMSNLHS